ncbi:universal stress protein [Oricola thermophila]|uniref:Universal stress protein n=1 Tax=Oricola thermophila TaxID=2742145 RepID=A0A6N1VEV8_9HYPH|nr:universal stress protein [Oricola thermophila]QKV19384.1 universal stress protein [Oricola thermophila]
MKKILVATDFSARSDRAIRRATLLAREFGATVTLVHVVDDDQPRQLVESESEIAEGILAGQCASLREIDGLDCDFLIEPGDPFEGIAAAAGRLAPDLLVIGAHRRQALRDMFAGTTAERTVRNQERPVAMANAVPAGPWRHVLVGIDLSDNAAAALDAVKALGIADKAVVTALHVFDAPGTALIAHSAMTRDEADVYVAGERARAERKLAAFLERTGHAPDHAVLRFNETSVGAVLAETARELSADLIVVGTGIRPGISRTLLGSTTDEVFRICEKDVMAVPAR